MRSRFTSGCGSRRLSLSCVAILCAVAATLAGCDDEDAPESALRFTDVTEAAGLGGFSYESGESGRKWLPETMGAGAAFLDADGDGWSDILLVGGGAPDPAAESDVAAVQLYLNDGAGGFRAATEAAGLADLRVYGFGLCVGDVDDDGAPDAVLTTLHGPLLLRNEGGRFVAEEAFAGANGWSTAANLVDADRDGLLDLFVGGYVDWSPDNDLWCSNDGVAKSYCTPEAYRAAPIRFFHNTGEGFADRTAEVGLDALPGKTLGAVALDFDADGWPDLFVANDTERDLLLRNDGRGGYSEVGRDFGVAYDETGRARAGMGVAAGDVDGSGRPSLFVANFSKETIGVWRYDGQGIFTDRALPSGIGTASFPTLGFGLDLSDYDLDGDLDLFVANGHVQREELPDGTPAAQPPHLFVNDGQGEFVDIVPAAGSDLARPMVARGVAHADYDRDGDVDLLVTDNRGPVRLLRNEAESSTSLRVHLRGVESNREGIGAELVLRAAEASAYRTMTTCGSYLSSSEPVATFGTNGRTSLALEVRWPNGAVDRLSDLPTDADVLVEEGSGMARVLPRP